MLAGSTVEPVRLGIWLMLQVRQSTAPCYELYEKLTMLQASEEPKPVVLYVIW